MDGTAVDSAMPDHAYRLDDNLVSTEGRIFLTGTQALLRSLLSQRRLDRQRGLNTAGFVSGYRGSPLGGVDLALWRSRALLQASQIDFLPAINEDMAATVLMGTQHAGTRPDRKVDGVFGLWYGKGPGVDRAGDALHHGTAAGASRHGGVLVVVGDDHTAVSSSIPHASESSLIGWSMPVVHPASVQEYEAYALWGWALSRYAGTWVAFKAVSETVESGRAFELGPPADTSMPIDPRWPPEAVEYTADTFLSPAIERRIALRMKAVAAFARRHGIDVLAWPAPRARVGIVTVGKAHLDTLDVLARLGLDDDGTIRLYKAGLTWPLEEGRLLEFADGLNHVLVIEEKGSVVESQVKDMLFNLPDRPTVCGKRGLDGNGLIAASGQLQPSMLAKPIATWLDRVMKTSTTDFLSSAARLAPQDDEPLSNGADGLRRRPYFCPGCPHSTSTRVPAGSTAQAGVGCHFMAAWMDRDTAGLTQMGGEGADWIGLSRYTTIPHLFQNMGEGTYFHSGYLAIRQAVAAKTNITYKILFNDAVAMTGGQPVDGPISVPRICQQMLAEGVGRVVITSDEPEKYRDAALPAGVAVHHRRELDRLQRELREIPGVTVLVHDQACAAEKRRRRKKGGYPDPQRRLFINTSVCEGCGDCGVQSNCLAVVPVETVHGRKRAIDQSSCNKDYSCVEGFCPSFVSVIGGRPRQGPAMPTILDQLRGDVAGLPAPESILSGPYRLLVAGVGGTGVITIGALVSMAAHLEGHAASVLDLTGLAQKGGTVISHIKLAPAGAPPVPVRVDRQQADAAILCDLVVAMAPDALGALRRGHTQVVANTHVAPLSDFTRHPDTAFHPEELLAKVAHAAGASNVASLDAHGAATALFGDGILSNIFMLGYAWQRGWVPVGLGALRRAVELNGVAPDANHTAFDIGRLAAHDGPAVTRAIAPRGQVVHLQMPESLEQAVHRRAQDLAAYQNDAYADRFRAFVDKVAAHERQKTGQTTTETASRHPRSPLLAMAVARNLYKLMAYKDEYEVARLYTNGDFKTHLANSFEGEYRLRFHMAPPIFARKDPATGIPRKMTLGPGTYTVLKWLAPMKRLRGTVFDVFGYSRERRAERALVAQYMRAIEQVCEQLDAEKLPRAIAIAALPDAIRGYGHIKARNIERYGENLAQALQTYTGTPLQAISVRRTA